jgi:hypothetical protein
VIILYSFLLDLPATLHGGMPRPYEYWFLVAGILTYIIGFQLSLKSEAA